jgi:FKBP-type peptidyl-prolyl cis-trans isomerase SlpA
VNTGKQRLLPETCAPAGLYQMNDPISPESTVTLHLSLGLKDGTVAESTFEDEPLTFTMGDGTLVEGLELGLYGLKAGNTQRLVLEPEQAYGLHDPARLHQLSRSEFSTELELEPGVIIGFDTPTGEELSGTIISLTDETVEVDFNHPLAGRVVVFEVEIIAVVPVQD